MGLFDRKPKPTDNYEASLLRLLGNLTPSDIDRLESIIKNVSASGENKVDNPILNNYLGILRKLYSNNIYDIENNPVTRDRRYEIYDEMDESTAYISSALDILSDDATQPDENGDIIHIKSDNEKVIALVEELFDTYDIKDKVAKWARAIAKYGDLFVKLEGVVGEGIIFINDSLYPSTVTRRDYNGKLLAFNYNPYNTLSNTNDLDNMYAPWEFVHFRHKGDIYREERKVLSNSTNADDNTLSYYGQSILRPAIKVYAQLRFVENMMILSRFTNSIKRNIFLINVGDLPPEKSFDAIDVYSKLLKKDVSLDIESSAYNAQKHTVTFDEDIFIPVGDPQNDVKIEQVGGDAEISRQYDLEYILNKLFAALKVPKAYLNYEQDLNARSTLIQLDIRYARSVSQIQNTIESGLMKIARTHLAYKGLDADMLNLEISLTNVSSIDEESRMDQLDKKVSLAKSIWDLTSDMLGEEVDKSVLVDHILTNYVGMDKSTVNKLLGIKDDELNNLTEKHTYKYYVNDGAYPTDKKAYLSRILDSKQIQ